MVENKSICLIIIQLTVVGIGMCQNTLQIDPTFCEFNHRTSRFSHELKLFRGTELITADIYPIDEYTVSNLEAGKYILKYKNIFEQEFEKEVEIDEEHTRFTICVDEYVRHSENMFVGKLDENDRLKIRSYSTGCFYENNGAVEIIRHPRFTEIIFTGDSVEKRKIANEGDLKVLQRLEDKILIIKEIEGQGYTTTFNYEIELNGEPQIKTNFGIDAIGFNSLIDKIFQ